MNLPSRAMTPFDALAGSLCVRPGVARPHNLVSTRSSDVARRITRGRFAADLPGLLGNLFSLCGQAHHVCASLALEAAGGAVSSRREPVTEALRLETMREHLRRIWLDWPPQLGRDEMEKSGTAVAASATVLASCPLFRAGAVSAQTTGLTRWLEVNLLEVPAAVWLMAWRRDPRGCLRSWSEQATTGVARLLAGCREAGEWPGPGGPALRVHADDIGLAALASAQRGEESASDHGHAAEHGAETGPWARLNAPAHPVEYTPWLRLGARVAELLSLATEADPRHIAPLMNGCVATGPRQGLGWVEMARGLLVHAIELDGGGAAARVEACHVLAPTDWNFHPCGPVAGALEALPALGQGSKDLTTRQRVRVLMAAYDPCVPYAIETHVEARDSSPETKHA